MEKIIKLDKHSLDTEHICCAFSDKKCQEGYNMKKEWLKKELDNGYVFLRLDARAKVFIEYGHAEYAWQPITAPNYLAIGCFWVSGKYKGNGYGKELLRLALDDAKAQDRDGLVAVVGKSKLHFMGDTKWLLKQGFEVSEEHPLGFLLLTKKLNPNAANPSFVDPTQIDQCSPSQGLTAYYTNRCPFAEYHVRTSLVETAAKRGLPLTIIKMETMQQAQASPSPATIFSLFHNGAFITTDISVCMDSRFDKIMSKHLDKK